MRILIVGNILKDTYLNLDNRTEHFETDRHGVKWLDLAFNSSEHHFFNQSTSLGGAAVTLEVLTNLGLTAEVNNYNLTSSEDGFTLNTPVELGRYILISDEDISYLSPSNFKITTFEMPTEPYDCIYIDRSATLDRTAATRIQTYLDVSPNTKLVLYLRSPDNPHLNSLIPRASLIFYENHTPTIDPNSPEQSLLANIDPSIIVNISDTKLSYLTIAESISINRIDMLTHLSAHSITSATILGTFILGYSVGESLAMAKANVENSHLNSTLTIEELLSTPHEDTATDPDLIAKSLLLYPRGILAADESGGSIHKKFDQLQIPDTYDNRRDYRNIFFTTPGLENYINGVILFDETAHQLADNGQNFVEYLISKRIIPGIKVDEGLEHFSNSQPPISTSSVGPAHPDETWTKGLNGLPEHLADYYQMGLRFAKWRAAFEIHLDAQGNIITPTNQAIEVNCIILAEYAKACQSANIVPIVEPEVVYDGYYNVEQCMNATGRVLDCLFDTLQSYNINLSACILKVNMIQAGKQFETQSTPDEVGEYTAKLLLEHVPKELAGVVFLSGGQTVDQATDNLAAIIQHGPYPWPVTFSFARAMQDPALYAWAGNNTNADKAREAFAARLVANTKALKH